MRSSGWAARGGLVLAVGAVLSLAAGCASSPGRASAGAGPAGSQSTSSNAITTTTLAAPPTTTSTTVPCSLSASAGSNESVPINEVCSSQGTPHFDTPEAAMTYLAAAWNSGNVQEIDYVTNPAGRQEMDAMAAQMVNMQFKNCTANPAGDYTCFFSHDIAPSTSPTTYPNPMGYPPGEAVFTVAPAETPGWYLTQVIHCG